MIMQKATLGKIYELKAYSLLKKEFDKIEFLGNKRKIFDYRCFKNGVLFNVEVKFSSGTGFTIFPKELDADIIILFLGEKPFIFRKFNGGIFNDKTNNIN